MSGGTFNVSRKIWNHPEFKPEPFSEREAFLWLVSEASWKDRTARAGRVVVDLRRGQLCASVRFMAEAWQWSKSRVNRFLQRLEKRDMLVSEIGTGQLVITLCNYETFQGQRDTSGTRAGQQAGHERDSSGTNYKKDEIQKEESEKNITPLPPKGDGAVLDILCEVLPRDVAETWIGARREARKKITERAARMQADRLRSFPERVRVEAVAQSIANNWQGLFPEKIKHEVTRPNTMENENDIIRRFLERDAERENREAESHPVYSQKFLAGPK